MHLYGEALVMVKTAVKKSNPVKGGGSPVKLLARRPELRPFTQAEMEGRAERARKLMTKYKLDAVMVTSEPNLEYLSGFMSQFPWASPSRPWYFVLPRVGQPTAVIPETGVTNWRATSWVKDMSQILTWPSPRPENEGLDLLESVFKKVRSKYGRIGFEIGPESRLAMAPADLLRIVKKIKPFKMADCVPVLRDLRFVKSPAEIARIKRAADIAADAFDDLPAMVEQGDTESDVGRKFAAHMLLGGADKTPYTAFGSGTPSYDSIIMGPTSRKLRKGDVFLIDTGCRYAGYHCDFDRNIAIGEPTDEVKKIHDLLYRSVEAGIAACVPGNTAEDLFYAQAKVLEDAGIVIGTVGRFGHGLGKNMTEYPSNKPGDTAVLVPGAVMTIEPSAMFQGDKMLVHEENVLITEGKPKLLSRRAVREMPVVRW
jgi:Xaa-Pro aminopeptidase